ncbi:hypothetical protein LG943_16520 [Streptomonospora sp. S1-112]|uniref:Uncharacterized protein n=1 Tax=Streptomonospora mangrovi TaxID=2883123 RepID=A0A9X3SGE2_9ACTN|nr:hypothetical protein [Streptomonospora mangrovi]MDA0565905.1 hypothetical protein [Streptomonospora mangrovi]
MSDPVTALADRVAGFTFRHDPARQGSQTALLEEYLRRAAHWQERVPDAGLFGDFAAALDPAVRADPALVERVRAAVPADQSALVRDTCLNALHFRALEAAGRRPADLPDPFEPLLLMYERGDGFHSTQGYYQVGASGVKKRRPPEYRALPPRLPDLEPATLRALDAAYAERRRERTPRPPLRPARPDQHGRTGGRGPTP